MAMTPGYRFRPRAKRSPADYGPMCATIGRLAARRRQQYLYYSRDALASTPSAICKRMPVSCRLMRMADTTSFMKRRSAWPGSGSACWVHARRRPLRPGRSGGQRPAKAQGKTPAVISPIALEAVRRIDALFDIERQINGQDAARRKAAPRIEPARRWRPSWKPGYGRSVLRLSRHNHVAQAMDYMLKRWPAFTRFLNDGRIRLSNNAAERALRGIALGRRAWLFHGNRSRRRSGGSRIALS